MSSGVRLGEGLDFLMQPTPNRQELAASLAPFNQEHLLRFWDELDEARRKNLGSQIAAINVEQIDQLFHQGAGSQDWAAMSRRAKPAPAMRLADRQHGKPWTSADARKRGAEALTGGEIGVLLVAGGQGSRLGFDHPKGMYSIGPVSGASLLQIHFEKALASARRYGAPVPIYMMTSPVTHDKQAEYLDEHDRFGVPRDDVVLFCQGTMPAVDASTGNLLLAAKESLFLSPDGHGGTVAALAASGAIEHMRRRGIRHLFYLQVDNPLAPIADPEFIGNHLLANSELTSVAVAKQTPQDRLGVFAIIDDRLQVIEYSDLPDDVANKRTADGSLEFWAGSIAVHMFSVAFLERALTLKDALPFHIAHKKVPFIGEGGRLVEPREPNALKFERFIFDLLPHASNPFVVEYAESDVFAPLKNAPGAARDTPDYVHQSMIAQNRKWLMAAGTKVADGVPVEISPLWALDAEAVAARSDRPRSVDSPIYLSGSY
jgi:UDP-N-acetylglucosamine/UDP-N-acetylgalactosamine diphosphorylase